MVKYVMFQVIVALRNWAASTLWCEINNERDMYTGQCDEVSGVWQGIVRVLASAILVSQRSVSIMQLVINPSRQSCSQLCKHSPRIYTHEHQ